MEIPIFPLSIVHFPGCPINLQIFEPRYKEMIKYCLKKKVNFGVVLIKSGQEAHGPLATPHNIGCIVSIHNIFEKEDGKMNLMGISGTRFEIHNLLNELPYLTAQVKSLSVDENVNDTNHKLLEDLKKYFIQYLKENFSLNEFEPSQKEIPKDSLQLCYNAAAIIRADQKYKQEILKVNSLDELLILTHKLYITQMQIKKSIEKGGSTEFFGPFSAN